MSDFEINILGCGSALPTVKHYPTSQVVALREKMFMVDCGEGAQLQFRRKKLKFSRLNHIFISHLHGDHCFGLPGIISTLALLGRTGELVVHAHPDIEKIFGPILSYCSRDMPFQLRFNSLTPSVSEIIYEDRSMRVRTIPLRHRIPTCGFLFEEKPKSRHLIRDIVEFYKIPLKDRAQIRDGADYTTPEGKVIPNNILTREADKSYRYAYCSDTIYTEKIIPLIEGVDVLYHESTFANDNLLRAKETFHSTAIQAAEIARKANVGRLILGHYSARYLDNTIFLEEAISVFPNTILAQEGLVVPVSEK